MTKPQLIIPMSGLGKRFMAAGYSLPKPLIPIFGDPMIAYVLRMYEGWDDVVFVVNKNHLSDSDLHLEETLLNLRPKGKVVAIKLFHHVRKGLAWIVIAMCRCLAAGAQAQPGTLATNRAAHAIKHFKQES